jgi:hypothetical protein
MSRARDGLVKTAPTPWTSQQDCVPLAIASVTAVLRECLANGLVRYSSATGLGDVHVTILPPDRIAVGSEEPNQLNLFMYHVTPHPMLGSHGRDRDAADGRAPGFRVALGVNYLLTAYSSQDFHAEILLGCAIQLLGSMPILTREIASELLQLPGKGQRSAMSRARTALSSSFTLATFDRLRVTQQFVNVEEMSKLWSALQARFRPSVAYEVSAVTLLSEGWPS